MAVLHLLGLVAEQAAERAGAVETRAAGLHPRTHTLVSPNLPRPAGNGDQVSPACHWHCLHSSPSSHNPQCTTHAVRRLQAEEEAAEGSDWETASEEDMEVEAGPASTSGNEEAGEWDVRRSLFDNHVSTSLEANLEYMWKHFGFYLPDAEYILDPEALVQYLVRGSVSLMRILCSALL